MLGLLEKKSAASGPDPMLLLVRNGIARAAPEGRSSGKSFYPLVLAETSFLAHRP